MTKLRNFFDRKNCIWTGILLLISVIAFWIRWNGMEYITADMEICLIPWSADMKTGYGPSVLSTFDGDYNMPYVTVLWLLNYLPGRTVVKVKLFSVVFDYLGAIAGGLIVARIYEMQKDVNGIWSKFENYTKEILFVAVYTAVLFYPSAVLNSAYWGQCDMIYVTFLLYMIYALLRDKPSVAMILLGCAFSFKLQAVLILPVLVIYYWKTRRISIRHFLWIPVVMELLCIPAIIGGCSVFVPFSVYLRQLGRYPYMYVFYPNIWALFKDAPYYIFSTVANLSIIGVLGVFAVLVIRNGKKETAMQWLRYVLWSVFFTMCFLPCMHERYGMLLEIIAILYAFLDRKYGIYAMIIGAGSYVVYVQTTFGKHYFSDEWIAIAYLLCLGLMTYQVITDCKNDLQSDSKEQGVRTYKWESMLMDFVNKYMLWIAFALLTVFAIVIRKPMMECMSADYLQYLIETDGTRSTTLYMTMMWVLSFLQEKPLFFLLKLVCILADLMAAVFVAVAVGKQKGKQAALVAYALLLYLPTTYLVSSIWGHVDGFAIAMFALVWLIADSEKIKRKEFWSGLCLGMAIALIAHYMIPAIIFICVIACRWKEKKKLYGMIVAMALVAVMASLSGVLCGYDFGQCVIRLFTWDLSMWIYYPVVLLLLVLCMVNRRWMLPTVALQMTFILQYGQFLYEQIIVPDMVIGMGIVIAVLLSVYAYIFQRDNLVKSN